MKNYFSISVACFLFGLIIVGCSIEDSVSNSAGPSTPSNIIINLEANPPSVPVGGSAIITVTLLNAITGVPVTGALVVQANSSGASGDDSGITGSAGQIFWIMKGIGVPTTFTFAVEDIAASIRVNISG